MEGLIRAKKLVIVSIISVLEKSKLILNITCIKLIQTDFSPSFIIIINFSKLNSENDVFEDIYIISSIQIHTTKKFFCK